MICREGSGSGHGVRPTPGEAHESAFKQPETVAMKRALVTFGNPFGLALYDKEQNGVRSILFSMGQSGKEKPAAQPEETLAGIELFKSLPPSDLEALAERCRWRRYAAGSEVVSYQDEPREVYFIVPGEVRVTIHSLSGRQVTFADFGTG
ncbi:MAG: Rad52/Rad22 family DNA repair protein, partial [Alphaproteobacteria bacterium]|nr:Rad52/Rad22 family DNA repair protein [Alphaproteobacteria bacterium]